MLPFRIRRLVILALLAALPSSVRAEPRAEFTRMIAHWAQYADKDYLAFVEEARPQVCQIGFYGGHFYSLVHTPQYKGYPAHFPVQGIDACGGWHERRNQDIHKLGPKVVGHFNVTFLVGEPDGPKGPRGFFHFYRNLWNEKELGPRPVKNPLDLLARNADGSPMASKNYSIGGMREYTACLNNPHWRAVLKAWAKRGIERGVDGYQINYFYRHNCLCEHCQAGFRDHLTKNFTPKEVRSKFGVDDVAKHKFTEIVGWHDPQKTTPLRLEMLRWSQMSCKRAFDDVFVKYARSLKPGLLLSQWNHLGNFEQIRGDERCLLPKEMWGNGEDYLWYSTGGAACFTDLAEGVLGEGTLQARYIRGTFDDKPFTLGKYESTRIRVAISELAANGGAPMGFYTRYTDPAARKVLVQYYRFLGDHDRLYNANRSHAEALLLYPRTRVHKGDVEAVTAFRQLGDTLLDRHVLFDVLPDDLATPERRAKYTKVYTHTDKPTPPAQSSRFSAPNTVRISASIPRDGKSITLHFVNYNRVEPEKKRSPGRGIQDEKPIAVERIAVDFVLPTKQKVERVTFLTPEADKPVSLIFTREKGRVRFTLPKFLVYAVVRVE